MSAAGRELLPCPFCGNAELDYKPPADPYMDERHHEHVRCQECGATMAWGWKDPKATAIDRWNRRVGAKGEPAGKGG